MCEYVLHKDDLLCKTKDKWCKEDFGESEQKEKVSKRDITKHPSFTGHPCPIMKYQLVWIYAGETNIHGTTNDHSWTVASYKTNNKVCNREELQNDLKDAWTTVTQRTMCNELYFNHLCPYTPCKISVWILIAPHFFGNYLQCNALFWRLRKWLEIVLKSVEDA